MRPIQTDYYTSPFTAHGRDEHDMVTLYMDRETAVNIEHLAKKEAARLLRKAINAYSPDRMVEYIDAGRVNANLALAMHETLFTSKGGTFR